MPAAWPFHCPEPQVAFVADGPSRESVVQVTWWRERSSDLNKLAPLHRSAFTYLTWNEHPGWGRAAPYAGTLIADELSALDDPYRCDGTCTRLADGSLSALTTMYNSADNSFAAADFAPCVANRVPSGDPRIPTVTEAWFEPGSGYPGRGWVYRFSIALSTPPSIGNCSLQYTARRLVPSGARALYVVQVGSTTGCVKEYCAGAAGPLVTFGGNDIVRMATQWPVPGTNHTPSASIAVTSAVVRSVGITQRTTVQGVVSVPDPRFWPGVTSVTLRNSPGGCAISFENATRYGSEWSARFTAGCRGAASSLNETIVVSAEPWKQIRESHVASATFSASAADGPPAPVGVPAAKIVPFGSTATVRFGMAVGPDEAFWEIVSADSPGLALSSASMLNVDAPTSCGEPATGAVVTMQGPAAVFAIKNTLGGWLKGACLRVGVAPVTPVGSEWPPRWRSLAAAARFSAGGATSGFVSTAPVWDNGTAATSMSPGYPYSTYVNVTPTVFMTPSAWMGFTTTVASTGPLQNSSGRGYLDMQPPYPPRPAASALSSFSPAPASIALSANAIALVCISGVLLLLALGELIWHIFLCVHPPEPARAIVQRPDEEMHKKKKKKKEKHKHHRTKIIIVDKKDISRFESHGSSSSSDSSDSDEKPRHHGHGGGGKKHLRFMALLLMPCLAMGCTTAKTNACTTCGGTMTPSTCMCMCGYSKAEASVYALFAFPAITMMFLYI